MIHGLQGLGWTKVDVSFHAAPWPFFAHNNIHVGRTPYPAMNANSSAVHVIEARDSPPMQVKSEWLYNEGAGVIAHVADSLKRQESRRLIPANL